MKKVLLSEGNYQQYLSALLNGERLECRDLFKQWVVADMPLTVLYEDIIQRSLYEVGLLWERGRISVATEHLASAITESVLNLAYPRLFSQPRCGRSAVVACVADEYHQIGGKMVADFFELHGWRGYFLGANMPLNDINQFIEEKRPNVVALSVTLVFNMHMLLKTTRDIRSSFPETPIIVGGQVFRWGGSNRTQAIPGVQYLASLTALESWMKTEAEHGQYIPRQQEA